MVVELLDLLWIACDVDRSSRGERFKTDVTTFAVDPDIERDVGMAFVFDSHSLFWVEWYQISPSPLLGRGLNKRKELRLGRCEFDARVGFFVTEIQAAHLP